MTFLSSIFSFDTLRFHTGAAKRRWPAGAICALAICLVVEVSLRGLWMGGALKENRSLSKHVRQQMTALKQARPDAVWLLGNSTLDYGIDERLFASLQGAPAIKLTHGSASLRGSAQLLEFYLRHAPRKPARVIVTLTKDDLNANGYRAEQSKRYQEMDLLDDVPTAELLAIRATRDDIKAHAARLTNEIARLIKHRRSGDATVESGGRPTGDSAAAANDNDTDDQPADLVYDGKPIPPGDAWHRELLKNFTIDQKAFQVLADVCRRYDLPPPTVVMLPVTDKYIEFHQLYCPNISYEQIRAEVARLCQANGLQLVDLGSLVGKKDYALYRDYYHVNRAGRPWLTRLVASGVLMTHNLPATAPSSSSAVAR